MKLPVTEESVPQILPATYYNNDWWPGHNVKYTCQIQNPNVTIPAVIKGFKGAHLGKKTDNDVLGLRFDGCEMTFVPRGFCSHFAKLQILLIFNSNIQKLEKNDFVGCGQLKEIWFNSLNVEHLPGDLFHHMPDLEIVSIQSCNVKYIDSDLLDNLPKLKVAKFNLNAGINEFYDSVSKHKTEGLTLKELKQKFKELSPPADKDVPKDESESDLPNNVAADIKKFMQNEKFKDFTISVDGILFKVHKFIVAARSPVLADLIFNNHESTLKLFDMKQEIFEDILKYIYEDELPEINGNAFDLFSAACRFDLDVLKRHAVRKMTTGVTAENALEMLIYGKLYENESLQKNALDEIKKMFPDRVLSDELIEDTDKLKKIIDAKKVMDEKIIRAQEEFAQIYLFG